jgi:2-phospho-L-lactate guanylyltransferase
LAAVPEVSEVLVISGDREVWKIARQQGVLVEEEADSLGLNAAVSQGMRRAVEQGAGAVLILPVDLPYVGAVDVQMMLNSRHKAAFAPHEGGGSIVGSDSPVCEMAICTDGLEDGTNALFLNPAGDFDFQFGPGSFHKHLQEAQRRGRQVHVVAAPGLKFDIDNESDWFTYQASPVGR